LVTNPPLSIFIPLFTKKKFSLLIYDIYPDTLVSQQVFIKESLVVKWWKRINIKVFNRAEHIFTISEDMKTVVSKYVESNKIKVIYNWGHNEHMKPVSKTENDFLKRYNIQNKFVVLYSGNIGMTHDIDRLVDVADKLREDKNFLFILIGEGGKKEMIKRKISKLGLENCLFLPFQPLEVLPYSMGAADVCVVTTDRKQSVLSIPSKTYSFMSVGAAFLCITDKNSELGRLVTNEKIGKCFDADETVEMADYLLQLSNNPAYLDEYKNKARQLSYDYTPENANLYLETYISGK
jgi:glycosyltransferase involved in cell wall biosynthesis